MPDGIWGYLLIVSIALIAHEPWRWAGFALGRDLSLDGAVFRWVRLVANALVAALVMRLIVFPAGSLAATTAPARVLAVVLGVCVFYWTRRNLGLAILVGMAALVCFDQMSTWDWGALVAPPGSGR